MAKKKQSTITIKTQFAIVTMSVLVLVVLGLFVAILDNGSRKAGAPAVASESYGDVTLKGVGACLPKSGDGPQTQECAIGLKTASGLYYAVQSKTTLEVDMEAEVTGTLESVANSIYDVEGLIVVK